MRQRVTICNCCVESNALCVHMEYCHEEHVESNRPSPRKGASLCSGINERRDGSVRFVRWVLNYLWQVGFYYILRQNLVKVDFAFWKTIANFIFGVSRNVLRGLAGKLSYESDNKGFLTNVNLQRFRRMYISLNDLSHLCKDVGRATVHFHRLECLDWKF